MPKQLLSLAASSEEPLNSSLCEEGESEVLSTVQKITKAFTESGSNLHMVAECSKSAEVEHHPELILEPPNNVAVQDSSFANEHIAVENECTSEEEECTSEEQLCTEDQESSTQASGLEGTTQVSEILLNIVEENDCIGDKVFTQQKEEGSMGEASKPICPFISDAQNTPAVSESILQKAVPVPTMFHGSQNPLPKPPRRTSRVSDHIQHFNKLCLNDPIGIQKMKSPIKLERTPVRQSVRRINSMSELKRQVGNSQKKNVAGSPMVKAVSFDGSLSSEKLLTNGSRRESSVDHSSIYSFRGNVRIPKQPVVNTSSLLRHPANPQKTVLEDLTNQNISRLSCKKSDLSATTPNSNALRILSGREHSRYRGSPKNPIARVTFLPATKPLDL